MDLRPIASGDFVADDFVLHVFSWHLLAVLVLVVLSVARILVWLEKLGGSDKTNFVRETGRLGGTLLRQHDTFHAAQSTTVGALVGGRLRWISVPPPLLAVVCLPHRRHL